MGRFVRSLPNPSRSTKGSEKAVAMAYCQKVSDCGLKDACQHHKGSAL
jgi:hypothetical protein